MEHPLRFTRVDMVKLKKLLEDARVPGGRSIPVVKDLAAKLKLGVVVEPREIPQDTITMNSRVLLKDLDSKETIVYSLVFPDEADVSRNMISVLAPVGTALLGKKTGEVIEWRVPAGVRHLQVLDVLYQPEANGEDFR